MVLNRAAVFSVALLFAALSPPAAQADPAASLTYRWVGPAVMGGRIDAVAGVPGNPKIIYLGHSSAGLWKSEDGGLTFSSVFEAGKITAIGAVALDPKNAEHLYVGTGEGFPRNTAVQGDGIWESRDGGKHWIDRGLHGGGSIAKIAIDPKEPRIVLVALLGREFAPNARRGIYRTNDGGAHWKQVLYVNATTGGSDVAFDLKNPQIVYAGTFDFLRRPWTMRSGGPGSGLYRSSDGGRTWVRLTDPRRRNGLPSGPLSRVGVSICQSNPNVIYAFVPSKNGLLYRSTDGGTRWSMRNADQNVDFRPFYFSQVRCDPRDPRRVYAIAGPLLVSNDGGRRFRDAGGGGDNHDLWIDPDNSSRLLNGSDMGFHLSLNRGRTWNYDDVVPFAQVYRVGYDMDQPYHVMGGLQDHEVWRGPNERLSVADGVWNGDWLNISDWGDGQYAMADPRNADIIYEDTHWGDLVRADLATGERRYISPQPIFSLGGGADTYRYRFNWSAPLLISRFDPDTIYFGGNVLFRSRDRGSSWTVIAPDLTRCQPSQLRSSGGPITQDNTNAETYCTIYSIDEDARDPKTIWFGTDNGHVEITRDGGSRWGDASTQIAVPQEARVSCISASPTIAGTAYVSFDRHAWNDDTPYAFSTHDYGHTWSFIGRGLQGFVHVIREDPRNSSLLYAGTESGIFVSYDRGGHWDDLRLGMPHLPVFDLRVHPRDNDLIVGTHGRGFYILDDLTPLQQFYRVGNAAAYLFTPMPAIRHTNVFYHEGGRGAFVSENKPYGALLTLYLRRVPLPPSPRAKPSVHVRILDAAAQQVDVFDVQVHAGFNRFVWDFSTLPPSGEKTVQDSRPDYVFYSMKIRGPTALPGRYTAEVAALGQSLHVPITVGMDPRRTVSTDALKAQYDAIVALSQVQERAEVAIARLQSAQKALTARSARAGGSLKTAVSAMRNAVDAQLDLLRNPEPSGYRRPAEISEQLAYLRATMEQYDGPPTLAQRAIIQQLATQLSAVERTIGQIEGEPLTRLNAQLRQSNLPEVRF